MNQTNGLIDNKMKVSTKENLRKELNY